MLVTGAIISFVISFFLLLLLLFFLFLLPCILVNKDVYITALDPLMDMLSHNVRV